MRGKKAGYGPMVVGMGAAARSPRRRGHQCELGPVLRKSILTWHGPLIKDSRHESGTRCQIYKLYDIMISIYGIKLIIPLERDDC